MSDETQENMVDVEFRIKDSLQRSLHSVTLKAFNEIKILILEGALPSPLFVSEEKWDTFIEALDEAEEMSKVGILRRIATLVSDAVDTPIEVVDLDAAEEEDDEEVELEIEVQEEEEKTLKVTRQEGLQVVGSVSDRREKVTPSLMSGTKGPSPAKASRTKIPSRKDIPKEPFKVSRVPTPRDHFQVGLVPKSLSTKVVVTKESLLDLFTKLVKQDRLRLPIPTSVEMIHSSKPSEGSTLYDYEIVGLNLEGEDFVFDVDLKVSDRKTSVDLEDLWDTGLGTPSLGDSSDSEVPVDLKSLWRSEPDVSSALGVKSSSSLSGDN